MLCLSGFQLCIRLAARLDFSTARNTFVNALIKFTTLDAVKEMKSKHIQCIKMLIAVALTEGDYLEESWIQVLQAIRYGTFINLVGSFTDYYTSQLARLQLFSNGSHTDDLYFSDTTSVSSDSKHGKRLHAFRSSERSSLHGSHIAGSLVR